MYRSLFRIPVPRLPLRARAPRAAERSGDARTIQVLRDLLRGNATDELAKDPLDDARFFGHDLALARRHRSTVQCLHDTTAVAESPRADLPSSIRPRSPR